MTYNVEIFDNITKIVKNDLVETIKKGSSLSIASACFSIYAYKELKKQLESIDELRFIFTSPTFISEKAKKEKREFYIPRLCREKTLYGSEYEVKLRNELTQKAIAKECAEWIRQKVIFKSNITNENMMGFLNIQYQNDATCYMPLTGFTTTDIGCERGNNFYNMVNKFKNPHSEEYVKLFNTIWNNKEKLQDVTKEVIENITSVYKENSAEFVYFIALYNIFNEFLEDLSEDTMPNEATGYKDSVIWNDMLYDFQKDAALAIINKLERYNGCILADSVGLGKTFTALAVIKYYENRNKSVLVLCPKKLNDNWMTYKLNLLNNPIAKDKLRYDVLYHTDLSRTSGTSNGIPLDRINWGNYDLVVIDESHNFRNGGAFNNEKENRYLNLLNNVIRAGVKTKVLMLSATPVNNKFNDLKNQLELAYEGDTQKLDSKLNTEKPINVIFRNAQLAFNKWSDLEPEQRTTDALLKMLDFDFFELLDSVTIARSRKHIEKYYDMNIIGKFPKRLPAIPKRPPLTTHSSMLDYNQIYEDICSLSLKVYMPLDYIFDSKLEQYYEDNANLLSSTSKDGQLGREKGIRRLMSINLLKRLESSVHSFRLTLERVKSLINNTLTNIEEYKKHTNSEIFVVDLSKYSDDFDYDDQNQDIFSIGKKFKIKFDDLDCLSWEEHLKSDFNIIEELIFKLDKITPAIDEKLQTLLKLIKGKIENPINDNNKKIIIFSAFADTAEYLYKNVSSYVKDNFGLNTAMITGSTEGTSTVPKLKTDLNTVLTYFSPISKGKDLIYPNDNISIDVLIATDCISEGQNLQDCDYLVNYDIHWNPVKIIQRFGRIDRIGSKNDVIQLVNFWPDLSLDEYINLKSRVETRMKISIITSTGSGADNIIDEAEVKDLEYRKKQLERLQNEVVDIEEMNTGISIMDLGLNEFRLDLLEYIKNNPDVERAPFGMHAVVQSSETMPAGVIYVLKNLSSNVDSDNQNRLHPFYIVYISNDGKVICNHLEPKRMLDMMRLICKKNSQPDEELCKLFNLETNEGGDMSKYSQLLQDSLSSIINVKDESDFDSFFSHGESSYMKNTVTSLNDFELICFLVVM